MMQPITCLSDIKISCNKETEPRLFELLAKYRNCLATRLQEIGKTTYTKMQIQLTTTNPVSHNPYRLPAHQRQKLATMIAELLKNKIIRKSTSPYASPIVLIPKPDGTLRLCVDYRKLNNITVKEKFPLPLIEDQIDKLVNFKYFTLLDLFSRYYQIPMAADSIAKTAFITPDGKYEYLRMSFGLCNASLQHGAARIQLSRKYGVAKSTITSIKNKRQKILKCMDSRYIYWARKKEIIKNISLS
jgi:hypothetical protein